MKAHLDFYDEEEHSLFVGLFVAVDLSSNVIIRNEFEDPYCDTEFGSLVLMLRSMDYNNFAVVLVEDPEDFYGDEDEEFGYLDS